MREARVIDAALVRRLVASQFPEWAALPVRPVELDGWDNRTFHLGDAMSVRMPSAEGYVPQVEKEHRWLPRLAPYLPLPIATPIAKGSPGHGYPWPWSVYRWLDGEPAAIAPITDLRQFAIDLASFLSALYGIDATGGPAAGHHNSWRGGPLTVYDTETREAINTVRDELDAEDTTAIWEAALASTWTGPPVWVHGDVAVGNLLVRDGQLAAVIDFGSSGVGDPACDMVIAWTLFTGESRGAFRATLGVDDGMWDRGRGWALWKALITIAGHRETDPEKADDARRVLAEVLAEFRTSR